jgi:hypothetical protein
LNAENKISFHVVGQLAVAPPTLAMPLLPNHTVAFAHDVPKQKLPVHLCNFHPLMLHNKSHEKSYSRLMFCFYVQVKKTAE